MPQKRPWTARDYKFAREGLPTTLERVPKPPCIEHPAIYHNPLLGASEIKAADGSRERLLTRAERRAAIHVEQSAVRLCRTCPIFMGCLRNALCELRPDTRATGITAGLTARQLRRMQRKLGLPEAPSWSAQSDSSRGLTELAEHRAKFARVWESLTQDQIMAVWTDLDSRRHIRSMPVDYDGVEDAPEQALPATPVGKQLSLIPNNQLHRVKPPRPAVRPVPEKPEPKEDIYQLPLIPGGLLAVKKSGSGKRNRPKRRRCAMAS